MVSQVPLFLVIAESLLAFQASSYPELAGPDDADTEISAGDVDKIGSSASPYEFGIRFRVDGDYFAVDGLSMGDMVRINREFARVIREAKHARVV